jgi:hypothetical protein
MGIQEIKLAFWQPELKWICKYFPSVIGTLSSGNVT